MKIFVTRYHSPLGDMLIGSYNGMICLCDWTDGKFRDRKDERIRRALNADYAEGSSPVIVQTIDELEEYFDAKRIAFDIPVLMTGTAFQNTVWEGLQSIPYGETLTYSAQTALLGLPATTVRAVAGANGANPISILVPCHRVIGANGSLTGYAGGIGVKRCLLSLEQRKSRLRV